VFWRRDRQSSLFKWRDAYVTKEECALTEEELERVEIVLSDALPYELSMLEAAARYMGHNDFRE
jgi:hypothetical protein